MECGVIPNSCFNPTGWESTGDDVGLVRFAKADWLGGLVLCDSVSV